MSLMSETVVLTVQDAHVWLKDHLARVARLGVESSTNYTVYDLKTCCKCYFNRTDKEMSDHDFYTGCVACSTGFAKDMVYNEYRFTRIRSIEDAHEVAASYHSMVTFASKHVVASARIADYKVQKYYDFFGQENGYEIVPESYVCSRATPHLMIQSNCYRSIQSHPIEV